MSVENCATGVKRDAGALGFKTTNWRRRSDALLTTWTGRYQSSLTSPALTHFPFIVAILAQLLLLLFPPLSLPLFHPASCSSSSSSYSSSSSSSSSSPSSSSSSSSSSWTAAPTAPVVGRFLLLLLEQHLAFIVYFVISSTWLQSVSSLSSTCNPPQSWIHF